MSYRPPKEFGDRSPDGLSDLQALKGNDLPFAKSINGDTTTIKGNGFDTITKKQPAPKGPGRYVVEGRLAGGTLSKLMVAGGLRAPFEDRGLSLVGGLAGATTLGVKHSVLVSTVNPDGTFTLARTKNFQTQVVEVNGYATPTSGGFAFWVQLEQACYYKADAVTPAVEYETATFSKLNGDNVLPKVIYSQAGLWAYSTISGYDTFDHFAFFEAQIRPSIHMVAHAVVRRGALYPQGVRSATPDGAVPYPLFNISTDCGRTYAAINMDYLFAGSTYQYAYPPVSGTVGPPGYGGYLAVYSLGLLTISTAIFISLEVQIDTPSAISALVAGINYEPRIFRSNGLDLSTMTSLTPPSGYDTLWNTPLVPAFAENMPEGGHTAFGTIGYLARAVDQNTPNMLFVSLDHGATWQAPRPLPAIGRYAVFVEDSSSKELSVSVYEDTFPPQVVRYASTDYGLTWKRRQVIATNVITLGAHDTLNDFVFLLGVNPDDGSLPSASPMSGWRWDSRIPRFITR